MAHLEHYHTKFEQGKFYHIYNRSIDKNYFLSQVKITSSF